MSRGNEFIDKPAAPAGKLPEANPWGKSLDDTYGPRAEKPLKNQNRQMAQLAPNYAQEFIGAYSRAVAAGRHLDDPATWCFNEEERRACWKTALEAYLAGKNDER